MHGISAITVLPGSSRRHIAWVQTVNGVRNVWAAKAPGYAPRQITHNRDDDGQELTQLTFDPTGARLVWARGGDHDANWPAEGSLAPDPAGDPRQPEVALWSAALGADGAPLGEAREIAKGDGPALSAKGVLAFVKDNQVWTVGLGGGAKAERLFFDRGHDGSLAWSPDGHRLAFVSDRGDHAFIGVFSTKDHPLVYLAPSTGRDGPPVWSPDGASLAFVRGQGDGGAPAPILTEARHPWSIWLAAASGEAAHAVWKSPATPEGSYPEGQGAANLQWAGDGRLVFMAELDGWPHLYSLDLSGGAPVLLTPGAFMVEDVSHSADGRFVIYSANTGADPDAGERRRLFRTPVDHAALEALVPNNTLQWTPAAADPDHVAFIQAGPQTPPAVALAALKEQTSRLLETGGQRPAYPAERLVVPTAVHFTAPDGLTVHGQLFRSSATAAASPGIVFVHGGPSRQMMLGWHYMEYYSNAYAVNQYLAAHGYVVLSVNYRLGIGYGRRFSHPAKAGPRGAAEYQDVLAGARFLQGQGGVDPGRIGIWGGSYGGYLTGLALARNSDVFKAGVDLHGVHDWSRLLAKETLSDPNARFEQGERQSAMAAAFQASPDADIAGWASPVLLIAGDDDRNVPFQQTIDLARRLEAKGAPFDELILPNEIHGFLRHESWRRVDAAIVRFFDQKLAGVDPLPDGPGHRSLAP